MMNRTLSVLLSLALALACLSSAPASQPVQAAPVGSVFGYTLTSAHDPSQWIELNGLGLTPLNFSSPDDSLADAPVSLGFTFPFFENTYADVKVSTNGMLLLGEMAIDSSQHTQLPLDLLPNNLIAPFWAELVVGGEFNSGKVYAKSFDGYSVIEWDQVTLLGYGDQLLSFEAVLYAGGNIRFNYKTLNGPLNEMTVGLEDADGVDAYQVLYDEPGLSASLSLLFTYPLSGQRLKARPRSQGSFLINNRAEVRFTLLNTGTEPEVIGFQPALLDKRGSPWEVSFFDADGALLTDSDGDTYPDSGSPLLPNEARQVRVRLSTSLAPAVGDYNRWQVDFFSAAQPARRFSVQVQTAVPAAFAQNYYEEGRGLTTLLVSPTQFAPRMFYSSSNLYNLNLAGVQGKQFISVFLRGSRLNRTSLNYTAWGAPAPARIYSVPPPGELPSDLTIASLPNGSALGVAYLTKKSDGIGGLMTNLRLAIYTPSGDQPLADLALTSNTQYRYSDSVNVPEYSAPRVAALEGGIFLAAWSTNLQTQVEPEKKSTQDVWYALIAADGQLVLPPTKLTASQPGLTHYSAPALVSLAGNKALLAYTATLAGNELRYVVLDGSSGAASGETTLASGNGTSVDGVQLDGGAVILAWTHLDSGQINYAVLSSAGAVIVAPQALASPNGRRMDFVSAAKAGGQAVLTWGNNFGEEEFLYYALVDGGGELITPPTAFLRGSNPVTHRLQVNTNGYGNAAFDSTLPVYDLLLPVGLQNP